MCVWHILPHTKYQNSWVLIWWQWKKYALKISFHIQIIKFLAYLKITVYGLWIIHCIVKILYIYYLLLLELSCCSKCCSVSYWSNGKKTENSYYSIDIWSHSTFRKVQQRDELIKMYLRSSFRSCINCCYVPGTRF